MKHTKEPWIIADDDVFVEVMAGTKTVLPAIRKADAAEDFRRIVACVNACAGAATDDLEKHGFLAMRTRQVVALEAQRDELLAALGKIASPTQSDGLLWWQIVSILAPHR